MKKEMKYLFVLLLASLAGCTLLENDLTVGRPRMSNQRSGSIADSVKNNKSPGDPAMHELIFDTTVFVSAVRCSPGYDWLRDTSYGGADAQIILFRNGEELFRVKAGGSSCVSAAPDMHHILDGHLYTEYCDYSRTVICRDGIELFSIRGRELLKGLVVRDQDVYTLTDDLVSGKLVLRKNGEEQLSKAGVTVFGGFDDPSYGPNGALYEDDGSICFAYKVNTATYMVRDGLVANVPEFDVSDVKSVSGRVVTAGAVMLGHKWKNGRVWRLGKDCLVSGESADPGEEGIFRVMDRDTRRETTFKMANALIYCAEGVCKALDRDMMEKNSICFSSRCAALLGTDLAVLYTPRDGGTPYMSAGGRKTMFNGLEGYLTAVTAEVSPSSLLPLNPR